MSDFVSRFDLWALSSLNSMVGKSLTFDRIVVFSENFSLIKGGLFMMAIWGLWFWKKEGEEQSVLRHKILLVMLGSVLILVVARLSQVFMPYRIRPIHDDSVDFVAPLGRTINALDGWTSFPSDHAVVFFALAVGIMAIHRKLGIFLLLWAIFVIGFPRVYIGVHYPTDIIAGAAIGSVLMFLVLLIPVPNRFSGFVLNIEKNHAWLFYPVAFVVTWKLAILGPILKRTIEAVLSLIKALF